jgi:hypothetical protein
VIDGQDRSGVAGPISGDKSNVHIDQSSQTSRVLSTELHMVSVATVAASRSVQIDIVTMEPKRTLDPGGEDDLLELVSILLQAMKTVVEQQLLHRGKGSRTRLYRRRHEISQHLPNLVYDATVSQQTLMTTSSSRGQ